jgi:hypothetical protein
VPAAMASNQRAVKRTMRGGAQPAADGRAAAGSIASYTSEGAASRAMGSRMSIRELCGIPEEELLVPQKRQHEAASGAEVAAAAAYALEHALQRWHAGHSGSADASGGQPTRARRRRARSSLHLPNEHAARQRSLQAAARSSSSRTSITTSIARHGKAGLGDHELCLSCASDLMRYILVCPAAQRAADVRLMRILIRHALSSCRRFRSGHRVLLPHECWRA